MSFSIDTNSLVRISCFADAEKHWNNTDVIRGRDKAQVGVPLDASRRSWQHKALHRLDNGDAYSCRLYDTDCVVFHRNGDVSVDTSYDTQSTNRWLDQYVPRVWARTTGKTIGAAYKALGGELKELVDSTHKAAGMEPKSVVEIAVEEVCTLRFDPYGKLIKIIGITPAYMRRVDKSKAAKARNAIVKPFYDYIKMMKALGSEPAPRDNTFGRARAVSKFFADPTDVDTWAELFELYHERKYAYRNSTHGWHTTFLENQLKSALHDELYTNTDCYVIETLPVGYLVDGFVRDKNYA